MKCSLDISNFLEAISSPSHSVVFLYFFALITGKAFLSLLAILWNSAFKWVYLSFSPLPFTSLLFSAIYKASSDNHFIFLPFFFLGIFLITTSCTIFKPLSIVLQASYLVDLIPWIYLSLALYKLRNLIQVIPECRSGFPYFLQLKSEFGNEKFMLWATVSSQSCFSWLYQVSPFLAAKNMINLISYWPSGDVHV